MIAPAALHEAREQDARLERDLLYRDMFHASAVSAWHLDTSRAVTLLTGLRRKGIDDILQYAKDNPGFVHEALDATRVIDVNDETLRMFGLSHRRDVVGKSVARFWIDGQYEAFLGCVNCTFHGLLTYRSETRLQTLDGRQIDVLFNKSESAALQEASEALLAIVDMTDQVKAKQALVEAQSNLAHSARLSLLGELTASIAHEVNQPLGAITTHGEAGLRWLNYPQPDVSQAREAMVHMIDAAHRASTVIDRVRAMVTPAPLAKQLVSLNPLVKDAIQFVSPELAKRGAEYALQLADDLPQVLGDPVQLQQVMMNLALNAAQAMAQSPSRLLVVRTALADGDHLQLDLVDTGPGIAEDHIEQLFESFFTTKADGMGIGLAICRSIIDAHGGTISLFNLIEGGVRASVSLPVAPVSSPPGWE